MSRTVQALLSVTLVTHPITSPADSDSGIDDDPFDPVSELACQLAEAGWLPDTTQLMIASQDDPRCQSLATELAASLSGNSVLVGRLPDLRRPGALDRALSFFRPDPGWDEPALLLAVKPETFMSLGGRYDVGKACAHHL